MTWRAFRPTIEIEGETVRLLVGQLGAVDTTRLGEMAGRPSPGEMWGVDMAPETVLDLV